MCCRRLERVAAASTTAPAEKCETGVRGACKQCITAENNNKYKSKLSLYYRYSCIL